MKAIIEGSFQNLRRKQEDILERKERSKSRFCFVSEKLYYMIELRCWCTFICAHMHLLIKLFVLEVLIV
jgi:hypothetical protein